MLKIGKLEHRFVTNIPRELEPGVLYVSLEYATAMHSCCCGCGEQVVTPFSPTDWKMQFDGVSVSLWPSIGNWSYQCRSHYIIRDGKVIEAMSWSKRRIERARKLSHDSKIDYYENIRGDESLDDAPH